MLIDNSKVSTSSKSEKLQGRDIPGKLLHCASTNLPLLHIKLHPHLKQPSVAAPKIKATKLLCTQIFCTYSDAQIALGDA